MNPPIGQGAPRTGQHGAQQAARRIGWTGAGLLLALAVVTLAAPWIAPFAPTDLVGPSLAPPGGPYWLGTNDVGQDIFSRLLHGGRVSLAVGFAVAILATFIGTAVGLVSGYLRGPVDALLMRVVDVVMALPFLPLLIVLQVFIGPGLGGLVAVLVLVMWARPARELRSRVLAAREQVHVQASRGMGASNFHVLERHLLPDVVPLVIPQFVRILRAAILSEASLSFLGLGDPTVTTWGAMLFHAQARSAYLTGAWLWWILPPGLLIGFAVLGAALVGYALEEASRPRFRGGWLPAPFPQATDAAAFDVSGPAGAPGGRPTSTSTRRRDPPALRLDRLTAAYGAGDPAVEEVSLEVGAGEIVGLVGESGSGKSTLTLCAMALMRAPGRVVAGSVWVGHQDLSLLDADELRGLRGRRIALVPQASQSALNPVRTAAAQVIEALHVHGVTGPDAGTRARELMASVDLSEDRHRAYPHELSGGMRQRVLIAMALAHDPTVLLADEPTTGLDPVTQREVLELIARLRQQRGLSVLLVSHDLRAVVDHVDRVVVLQAGRVVETLRAADLETSAAHPYTQKLVASIPPPLTEVRRPPKAVDRADERERRHPDLGSGPLLRVESVSKTYPGRRGGAPVSALVDVSLTVRPGTVVGVVGRSGAGKSTLARLIAGLEAPDQGRVLIDGLRLPAAAAAERKRASRLVQLVFQDPYASLPAHMRVRDIVAEPLVVHGEPRESHASRVARIMEECGLPEPNRFEHRYPHQLSGGERQRVALARALVSRPALLVADEPTSLLDAPLRLDLVRVMTELCVTHGVALLYITHDLAGSAAFCDRLLVLDQGRVVEEGATAQVLGDPSAEATRRLIEASSRLAAAP